MRRKYITISPSILIEIERALNVQTFMGSMIGVTINDTLIDAFDTATRKWDLQTHVKDRIRFIFHRYFRPSPNLINIERFRDMVLCTWLFDRQDLKEFILPVLEHYGQENTFVVAPSPSMRAKLPPHTGFVMWKDFPKIDMKAWRAEFDRCEPAWRSELDRIVAKHSLPKFIINFLLDRLQVQSQRIVAAGSFLDIARPKVIVTEYDRNEHTSCLIIAARQRGIPSITMVHSALNPHHAYGFTPVHADTVCCWGERQVAILRESGADRARLEVTGCHAMTQKLLAESAVVKASIGVAEQVPIFLLATSPIKLQDRTKYATTFCAAMSRISGVQALIRLHPAERLADYQHLIDEFPAVKFFDNKAMSRDESLAAADVVFIHDSSFGSDALMKGKLVVVLDVLSVPLGIGQELADLAGCPIVRSAEALESLGRELIVNSELRDKLYAKGKQYAMLYCDSYGSDAAEKVFGVIDRAISKT